MNTEQRRPKVLILASKNPDELFKIVNLEPFVGNTLEFYRVLISTIKLEIEDPHLELIIKLFHRDEEFKGCYFKKVYCVNGLYRFLVNCPKNEYEFNMDKKTNWKRFKSNLIKTLKNEDCPICYEVQLVRLRCPTCLQSICENCLVSQVATSFKLKCSLCNMYLYENGEEEQEGLTKRMKQVPVKYHRTIAQNLVNKLYKNF